jgi:hypothetical protein
MDFAVEEIVLEIILMVVVVEEKILLENLSAKCPFSCIIMEKGG